MATLEKVQTLFEAGKYGEVIVAVWLEVEEERAKDDPEIPELCAIRAECHWMCGEWRDALKWAVRAGESPRAKQVLTKARILSEAVANLDRGRAIATGIGVFLVVVDEKGDPLLRRRLEKDSLYGQDLSGKWEMTGGGMELAHFLDIRQEPDISPYQLPILRALSQELEEEAGLLLTRNPFAVLAMVSTCLYRVYEREGDPRTTIDLALSIPVPFSAFEQTETFRELMTRGGLMFVPRDKLSEIEIVSPRTRFLIEGALKINNLIRS